MADANMVDVARPRSGFCNPFPAFVGGHVNPRQRVNLGEGLFVCGDHRDTASLQGAMYSGERTASAVLGYLGAGPPREAH